MPAFATWHEYEQRQWLKPATYQAYVQQKLSKALAWATKEVPYYRDLALGSNLTHYPVLDKKQIWNSFDELQARERPAGGAYQISSGGSTGHRVHVLVDRSERTARLASTWRGDCFPGQSGEPPILPWSGTMYFWGASFLSKGSWQRVSKPLAAWIFNRHVLTSYTLTPELVQRYHAALIHRNPQRIIGYASLLRRYAELATELKLKPPRVRKVIASAEQLDPDAAMTIMNYFQAPLRQRYGCREAGDIAHQCEYGNWHLHSDHIYPEVLRADGTIASQGEGRLLLTKLNNRVMPLVRYDIEDLVYLGGKPCPCGRALPVMSKLSGRVAAQLSCPDGRRVSSLAVAESLRNIPVREFRLIQEDEHHCRWLLLPAAGLTPDLVDKAHAKLDRLIGGGLSVQVELVDEIPPLPSGKRMSIICRLLN